jgi:ABC-type Zn uptake system ZnuABC Zn-binding protein ZnuA
VLLTPQKTGGLGPDQSDSIKIVTTMNFLGDFAEALTGSRGEVHVIITGDTDPHHYEPKPSDLTKLSESDLIIGLGEEEFDEWLINFLQDNSEFNDKVIYAANSSVLQYDPIIEENNPHFWLSPANAKILTENIANELIARELMDETIVEMNMDNYFILLDNLLVTIADKQNILSGTKVVVDHPAFFYLLELLQIERVGVLEEQEGIEPSPKHIQELSDNMKEQNIKLIVANILQEGPDVHELARNTGAKIAWMSPIPFDDADDYVSLILYNLDALDNLKDPTTQDALSTLDFIYFVNILLIPVILRKWKKSLY